MLACRRRAPHSARPLASECLTCRLRRMDFGIFGSAQAQGRTLGPETGQGFRDYLDYAAEAEALGIFLSK